MKLIPSLQGAAERLIREHVEQSHAHWGAGETVDARLSKLLKRLKDAGPDSFLMAGLVDDGNTLVSSLKKYYFGLRVRGQTHRCVGLGAIFTDPSRRKTGAASSLIESVLSESRKSRQCDFAFLFSDIGTAYYEKFGFQAIPALDWVCPTAAFSEAKPNEPIEARLASINDTSSLIARHEAFTRSCPLHFKRDSKSWSFFRDLNRVEQDWILSVNHRDFAQLTVTPCKDRGYLWVEEWAIDTSAREEWGPEAANASVWATIRKIAEQNALTQVRGWRLPLCPWPKQAASQPREKALPMIAALEPALQGALDEATLRAAFVSSPDHF